MLPGVMPQPSSKTRLAARLEVEECPFTGSPVQMAGLLTALMLQLGMFIENLMSFDQEMRSKGHALNKLKLTYALRFKGIAARLPTT